MSTAAKKTAVRKSAAATRAAAKTPKAARGATGAKAAPADASAAASRHIDERIEQLNDWRGAKLAEARALILKVDPDVLEEWKWRGVPVWSHDGILCTGETYKTTVKFTFAKGAALADPKRLFNSSLDGNTRRAIDLTETDTLDAAAFKDLVRAAIALNTATRKRKR